MTREKLIFREWHQMSLTYGHVTKLFIESEFQHKGNEQTLKKQILSKILQFSLQKQIQKMKLFKSYTEKDKKKPWTKLSSLGQEPTFKGSVIELQGEPLENLQDDISENVSTPESHFGCPAPLKGAGWRIIYLGNPPRQTVKKQSDQGPPSLSKFLTRP